MRDPAPPRSTPAGPGRLLSIQVLRALAALSVVVHHAGYDADWIAAHFGGSTLGLDRVFDWTLGIHLFFVISGFIMARTARDFGQEGAAWRFLARRLLRVAPLYWLTSLLVLVGAFLGPSLLNVPVDGWGLWLGSFLFVPAARVDGQIRPVLNQGWTLDYEVFFYVLFALAMLARRRTGLWLLAATLVGLVVLGRATHPSRPALIVWTDGLLIEFLLGIGISLAIERGLRLGARGAAILAAAGLAAAIRLSPVGGVAPGLDPWIAAGLPAAAILTACVAGPSWRPWKAVLILAALGDASYSLYLTHPFAIRLLRAGWAGTIGGACPPALFVPLAIAAAIVLALAVFRWVERPMTAALHRRFPLLPRVRRPASRADVAARR